MISSSNNPLVKRWAALKERRERERTGEFIIEGAREAERALQGGIEVLSVLHSPELTGEFSAGNELAASARALGHDLVTLSPAAFTRLSLRQNPDGIALLAKRPTRGLDRLPDLAGGLVLVVDGVEKPGNLGAMLRTADAVGLTAVILTGEGTDLDNPNVVRASQGSVFALPTAVADRASARTLLQQAGYKLVATSPTGPLPHWSADLTGAVALLVGAEDVGLSSEWLTAADERVCIVMRDATADSLNVSVATGVVLYEALRQRSA